MTSRTLSTPVLLARVDLDDVDVLAAGDRQAASRTCCTAVGRPARRTTRQFRPWRGCGPSTSCPSPRVPQKRYAWAMRPDAIAFFSVCAMCSCPMTSSNVPERYRRARTVYDIISAVSFYAGPACGRRGQDRPSVSDVPTIAKDATDRRARQVARAPRPCAERIALLLLSRASLRSGRTREARALFSEPKCATSEPATRRRTPHIRSPRRARAKRRPGSMRRTMCVAQGRDPALRSAQDPA